MSYTLTLNMPEKDIEFAKEQMESADADLGRLFIDFLRKRAEASLKAEKAKRQREAILAVAGGWQDTCSQKEIIADIGSHRGDLIGAAAAYADPSLRHLEKSAFRRAIEEKHVGRANQFRSLCSHLPPSGLPKGYVFSRDEATER